MLFVCVCVSVEFVFETGNIFWREKPPQENIMGEKILSIII